jgi:GPH family glycoside/pentoside/hexuronide:cation symporter
VALRETLANRPFRVYLVGEMFFLLALAIKGPIVIYLVTVVLGRSEGFAGRLGLIVAGASIISVPLIAWAARRLGVRRTLVASILITVPFLGALAFLSPASPGDPGDARNLSLLTVSLAALGLGIGSIAVLPRLLLAQIIDLDRQETGASRAALYYGVQGFLVKWVLGLGAAIVAFLFSRFGNSATEPLGVLLIGPAAAAISFLAALGFLRYPEGKVLEALAGDPTEPG